METRNLITHPAWDFAGATEVVSQANAIAFAKAAVLRERAACAAICDSLEAEGTEPTWTACAAAIRSQKEE